MPKKSDNLSYTTLVDLLEEIIKNTNHYDEEKDKIYENRHMPHSKRLEKATLAIRGG